MPSVNLNIKTENLNKSCFCNDLTYIAITPPDRPRTNNKELQIKCIYKIKSLNINFDCFFK